MQMGKHTIPTRTGAGYHRRRGGYTEVVLNDERPDRTTL